MRLAGFIVENRETIAADGRRLRLPGSRPPQTWPPSRCVTDDGNPNYHDWSIYFGIGGTSPFPGRSHDRFGVGYFHFGFSDLLKDEVAPVFRLRDQSGGEAFYNVALTPWFRISTNVQFIRPGAGRFSDAIYAGVSSYIRF